MRNTPRMIINTRKLTHTTMTTVAALGTTAMRQTPNDRSEVNDGLLADKKPCCGFMWGHNALVCLGAFQGLCADVNGFSVNCGMNAFCSSR